MPSAPSISDALRATTRDIPDYDVSDEAAPGGCSMNTSCALTISRRLSPILTPLEGAREFVDWLRERFQVVILSDTFYEFSAPLMAQLGWPTLLCHRLLVD